MEFQGTYRPATRWTVAGHWTVQLRNHGNFEGEAAGQPGIGSTLGDYPEILVAERNFPEGRFDDFQRHKVRLWTIYNVGLGRFGSLDVAPLWRYNSALTYSLTAAGVPLSAAQRANNPGYARLPGSGTNGSQTLFFGERGSQEFAGYGLVDLGLTYQVPLWRALRPWVEVEVLNVARERQADWVGYDDHRGSEQPARRERLADRLPPGRALRAGHVDGALPASARRADGWPHLPGGRRRPLLECRTPVV